MFDTTFFASAASIRNLKHCAGFRTPNVGSGHLSEAIAASLGFKTYAALRAVLKGVATVEVPKPSNRLMVKRLHELGYTDIPKHQRLIPEFERSYSPFRYLELRRTRGPRWWIWRNLVVAAINAGLEQRLFGLMPEENWWPGGAPHSQQCKRFTYRFLMDGDIPALASVDAISGDELSVSVLLNPKRSDIEPSWYDGFKEGDASAHCWLERRLGAWVQDGGIKLRCRKPLQARLLAAEIAPDGYSDLGSFILG